MSKSELHSEEKSKTWVLLTDSDGTIFQGNMKMVISDVIRFLKKSPEERVPIDELLTELGHALPLQSQLMFKSWLEKQETILWSKTTEELSAFQQMIAGFFLLIQYHPSDDDTDAKTSCTALNVFDTVWEKQGIVMILTFNVYAPYTIRQALVQQGLAEEKARQIYIIYPGSGVFAPHDRIYSCSMLGDGEMIDKNEFIQKAQRICREELKLTDCQYLFLDDQHARAAQSTSLSDVTAITDSYTDGRHLWAAMSLMKGQRPARRSHISVQSPSISLSSSVGHSSFFFPATVAKESESTTVVGESAHHHRVGSARQEQLTPGRDPLSSLQEVDNRTTMEILEGNDTEALSLMFPKPVAQTFNLAYARAQTPEQKIQAIVSAIKHFYPQTFHRLESSPIRLTTISPHWELHQWIQKLDELFVTSEENSPAQLQLVKTAQTCWLELQFSLIGEIADEKNKRLSRDTMEEKLSQIPKRISEENIQFLFSETSEHDSSSSSSSSSPTVLMVKELEKWRQRQLAIESVGDDQTPSATSFCCCLIA
jgi:hypothetical protein